MLTVWVGLSVTVSHDNRLLITNANEEKLAVYTYDQLELQHRLGWAKLIKIN